MARRVSISAAEARRLAISAQGLARQRPRGEPDGWDLRRVLGDVGLLQIDSVNVLERAHYLPAFSRLGPYRHELLDRLSHRAPRRLFEYWGHEASLLPVDLHPLLRWRMDRAEHDAWGGMLRIKRDRPELVDEVLEQVRERGPDRRLGADRRAPAPQRALVGLVGLQAGARVAVLVRAGDLGAAAALRAPLRPPRAGAAGEGAGGPDARPRGRPARAAPDRRRARSGSPPSATCATTSASRRPTRSSASPSWSRPATCIPVEVEGWGRTQGYLAAGARIPRRVDAAALIGPFDSLLWERSRVERIFGFAFRLEIYVPAPKRRPRLLRAPVPARRPARRARRPEGRPRRGRAAGAGGPSRGRTRRPRRSRRSRAELDAMADWLGHDFDQLG